jgi:hypothetical protein
VVPKPRQRRFEHLREISGLKLLIHRLFHAGLWTLLRQIREKVASGQDTDKAPLLNHGKIVLKTGKDVFKSLLQ